MYPVHLNLEIILQFWGNLDPGVGISWEAINPDFIPVLIFCLRTVNLTLSTLRVLAVVRGQRISVWILALLQSLLYIISITGVLRDLNNPLAILAYAGGFATGNVVGMWLESRLAPGHALLRITSSNFGPAIREALHEQDYGATELPGSGKDGTVSVLHCYAPRNAMAALQSTILAVDPQAFLTVVHVRQLRGGWRP